MLNWFINNSLYTYIKLGLLFIVVRLGCLYFFEPSLSIPNLSYFLLGESLNRGYLLYKNVWHTMAPLSAGTYQMITFFFGRSLFIGEIIAAILLLIQGIQLNNIFMRLRIFDRPNFFPLFFYLFFAHITSDLFNLSPLLLANSFIMFSLSLTFSLKKSKYTFMYVGMLLALSGLFFQPFLFFALFFIWHITISETRRFENFLFLLYGFSFVFLSTCAYFVLTSRFTYFIKQYFFFQETPTFLNYNLMRSYFLGWSVFFIFILFVSWVFGKYKPSDMKRHIDFVIILLLSVGSFFIFKPHLTPGYLFVFAIPFALFFTLFLFALRKKWLRFLGFWLSIFLLFTFAYSNPYSIRKKSLQLSKQKIAFTNKTILVLGDDLSYYIDNQFSGTFLDWTLSKPLFQNLNTFQNILTIDDYLIKDMPEVIIDLEGYMPKVFQHLPHIKQYYTQKEANIYYIINK